MIAPKIVHSGLATPPLAVGSEALFSTGAGGTATDVNGRTYFDFTLGYGSVVIGHANREFRAALSRYATDGWMLPGYSPRHLELIRVLWGENSQTASTAFFKTGSEAVAAAIRLATGYSGRAKLLRCGFLGWHDAELAQTPRWHELISSPLRNEIRYASDCYRGVSGNEAVYNWVSLSREALLDILAHQSAEIGCFLLDTYQARFSGSQLLSWALEECRMRGICCVVDDTKTAGRIAPLGWAGLHGCHGDLHIVGKAIANGAPLSVLSGRPDIMERAAQLRITGTFSQEIGAIHAALATAEQMKVRDGYTALPCLGVQIVRAFQEAIEACRAGHLLRAVEIFGGGMFEIEFGPDVIGDWNLREHLRRCLAEAGILILQGHCSYVCLDHTALATAEIVDRAQAGIRQWMREAPL